MALGLLAVLAAGGPFAPVTAPAAVSDGPYIFRDGRQLTVWTVMDGQPQETVVPLTGEWQQVSWSRPHLPLLIPADPPSPAADSWPAVDRIFAVSDIHGQHGLFYRLLERHGVIDASGNWRWGDGHLVIVGDVFDRGPTVTEALWAIHQLEQAARRHGGRVHFLLGNHEVMVLQGDLRYIHDKYKAAADILQTPLPELYGPRSVLGQWLRTKHAAVRIGDLLFVHGGITPVLARQFPAIGDMNAALRRGLDEPADGIENDPELAAVFGRLGPFWYRGYLEERTNYPLLRPDEVQDVLRTYGVSRIVVGHTTQKHVSLFLDGRVIAVDAGMKHGDRGEGLLLQNNRFFRAALNGRLTKLVEEENESSTF
ncbi:MAG: metallophosphoesterase [Acidobacteria bacterium]|nr:metallophosphoesterase [Acidobacteriota bacterium]